MSGPSTPRAPGDAIGRHRLALGGGLGLLGGAVAVAVPVVVLIGAAPGTDLASAQVAALGAAALLLFLSLLAYRSAFRALRSADARFRHASRLCLVGSIGFLLVLGATWYLGGTADHLVSCFAGAPGPTVGCARSAAGSEPAAGATAALLALLGAALAWVGGLGIVAGLAWEARRIRAPALGAGAVLYALTLLVLVGPFAAYFVQAPAAADSLDLLPIVGLLAPASVLFGTSR